MITLTPAERDIHRALRKLAQEGDPEKPGSACITYKGLGQVIDSEGRNSGMTRPPFRTMFPALGHVSMYEVEHGRPMLSALVVNQDTGTAGPGFAELARHLQFEVKDDEAFWRRELEEVVRFWSANDPVLVLDAAVDRVLDELKQVKTLLRKRSA
ncbi:hypothetical protein SAMN05446589_0560 [Streptomyces sp. OV198]|uniref:hypothetical protein n=1 Tax=Streptomyces sp. OV198 TaxID=1882787 RepID=UPI000BDAF9E9|nr:hypothetical protein [Streptomyces sp. OV198]SOE53614.1 hypothetical protein SAMN05446589_0560 [Streptomyces sp. OV198]